MVKIFIKTLRGGGGAKPLDGGNVALTPPRLNCDTPDSEGLTKDRVEKILRTVQLARLIFSSKVPDSLWTNRRNSMKFKNLLKLGNLIWRRTRCMCKCVCVCVSVCVCVWDINPGGISDTARVGTHCSGVGRTGTPDCFRPANQHTHTHTLTQTHTTIHTLTHKHVQGGGFNIPPRKCLAVKEGNFKCLLRSKERITWVFWVIFELFSWWVVICDKNKSSSLEYYRRPLYHFIGVLETALYSSDKIFIRKTPALKLLNIWKTFTLKRIIMQFAEDHETVE